MAGVTGPLSPVHIAALELRGLDIELLVKLGVGASAKPRGDGIAIPYRLAGVTVNHKYRTVTGAKAFAQDSGAPQIFWNSDALADTTMDGDPLIVTEGEFDAIVAMQCGFPRVVSVPGGAPSAELGDKPGAKYAYLDALPDKRRAPVVILAVDGDGPGANLLNDLARRIGRGRCKWVLYPKARDPAKRGRERLKDLNEVLEDYGERGVVETLNGARWMALPGLYAMDELPPLPEPEVFSTGIRGLDPHFRVRLGDFIVVTGVPSFGKTTLVNEICFNLARRADLPVCFASFEQSPQREHRRNLRTLHSGKLVKWMTGPELAAADAFIGRMFSFIAPSDDDDPTIEWLLERASAAALRKGAKVVVVDPWNELDHRRDIDQSLTEYVGSAIKTLKRFARIHDVALIVVAHPAKMRRDRDGKYPKPGLYDISDSANWANKADAGIVVHRDDDGSTISVVKARYADIGKPGELRAVFNDQTLRFTVTEEPA